MSSFEIKKITDRAGTGSPNFTNGVRISGTDSALLAPARTESDTQPDPETSSNGDTFYDTVNETYDILTEGAWTRVLGAGGGPASLLENASYDNVSFSVAGQETNPWGFRFNPNGTKMYIIGATADNVYQYTLSTGFDISTASYDNVSFNVTAQDINPTGVAFNSDGTKMYILGNNSRAVYQYTLSTGFNLSTASYSNVSFNFSGQDTNGLGIEFNPDGTKMYIVGNVGDAVYQYTLSTGFDISTASYDNVSFNFATQDATPVAIFFNADGTKMYMVGFDNDAVHQYTLSTGFNVGTASYDNVSFSFAAQSSAPAEVRLNTGNTKMYIVSLTNGTIFQYSTGL